MKLTFLDATLTVTGSKYLLEVDEKKYLIDCGLFQGQNELHLRNRELFPIDPKQMFTNKDKRSIFVDMAYLDQLPNHSGF